MEPTRLRAEDDEGNLTQFEAAIKLQNLFRGFLGRMRSPTRSRAESRLKPLRVRWLLDRLCMLTGCGIALIFQDRVA